MRPTTRSIVVLAMTLVASGAVVLYALPPSSFDIGIAAQPGRLNLGTTIVVAGYLLFPILAMLAAGLLLIAVMVLAGAAIERRHTNR